jgi:hypothetical protein
MGLSNIMGILNQYRDVSAGTPPPNVEQDYSQVAQSAPQSHLAGGLAEAFRSNDTPPFSQMLRTLFSNSNGEQRAGILNQLLGSVGPSLLASGDLSSLTALFRGGQPNVTSEQANQIPPEAVQQLAEHAEKQNPSIVDQASQFYAQHPTLVQALGAGSIALIMSHLSRR